MTVMSSDPFGEFTAAELRIPGLVRPIGCSRRVNVPAFPAARSSPAALAAAALCDYAGRTPSIKWGGVAPTTRPVAPRSEP
jgi:hypothetical protein